MRAPLSLQSEVEHSWDLRMVPVAAAAWMATWVATVEASAVVAWSMAGVALVALVVALRTRVWPLVASTLVIVVGLGIGGARVHQLRSGSLAEWAKQGAAVTCEVDVVSDTRVLASQPTRPAFSVTSARTVGCRARGVEVHQRAPVTVRATGVGVDWALTMIPGSRVVVSGLMEGPTPGQPVTGTVWLREPPRLLKGAGPGDRAVNHFRLTLRLVGAASPGDQRALLPSLVVGDTSQVDARIAEQFRVTALTHLMAVSGANLALTLIVVLNVARWVGVRGWWLRVVAMLSVAAFVVVCRAEPSVVRAAGMGVVALAALGRGSPPGRGIRHLAVAVVALVLIDPWLSRSLGFGLSVAACAGILWWARPWGDALRRWAPGWVAEAISVPIAAQVATQPLVTGISGSVSVVGLAANAAAAPFVGPATVLGLLAGLLGVVWLPAGVAVGWVACWLLAPILWIARVGAALPTATWSWPRDPAALVVLAASCALVAWLLPRVLSRRWLSVGLALVLVVAAIRPQPTPGWPGPWTVTACSVGQGDAWALRAGSHSAVLVDVGPDPKPVMACLRGLGVRQVPLIVLTHYHADHITGLAEVLDSFPVDDVVVSPMASPPSNAAQVAELASAAGASVSVASADDLWVVGAVRWRTIRAGPVAGSRFATQEGESSAENDSSIMGVATVGGLSVLFPGDSEPAAQAAALASGRDLRATVLAMPHHGSARQTPEFWQATQAVLAVASAGLNNDYGHPSPATLALAGSCGMQVARTDTQGSISIWLARGHLEVRARRVV